MLGLPLMLRSVLLGLLLGPAAAFAVTYPAKPPSTDWFVDSAGLLDSAAKQDINQIVFKLWKDQRVPIYVVTIPSLAAQQAEGLRIERYAFDLFNSWGIGSENRNFGMLLLVSKGDRKARIELGSGWGARSDVQAQSIMQDQIVPRFKEGDFSGGIVAGVAALDKLARGLELPSPYRPPWQIALWVGGILLSVVVGISLIRSGQKGWGWAFLAFAATLLFFLLKAIASSSAQSGSSSGGFGGGSSGGGGATGSW
jgi:uncharacterized protein